MTEIKDWGLEPPPQGSEDTAGKPPASQRLKPGTIASIQNGIPAAEVITQTTETVAPSEDTTVTPQEQGATGAPAETAQQAIPVKKPISPDPLPSATQGLSPKAIRSIQGR